MAILLIVVFLILLAGIMLLLIMEHEKRGYGVLSNKRIYQDTEERPGRTLYATTLNLVGRPDYIIVDKDIYIPVEEKPRVKKTPTYPYLNHKMQLMAYCYLVEENFGVRPPYGVLRYREKEFKIEYTENERQSLIKVVNEITLCITSKKDYTSIFRCSHPKHIVKV
jgi:CRISPR-associated exonuclease Cas4